MAELRRRLRIHARENWYRDLWLLLLTIILVGLTARTVAISTQANQAATQVRGLVFRVQHQRFEAITDTCRETNRRHVRTTAQIDQQVKAIERRHPARKAALVAQARGTALIIQALAPLRKDCRAYAARITHIGAKP